MEQAEHVARSWLAEMQSCVRSGDYARCRLIFSPTVVGFGTRAAIAIGLDDLEENQWRHVWDHIRDFSFEVDKLTSGGDGDLVWLACPWTSLGPDGNGAWLERPGRITAILERNGEVWQAVHTHHSLAPDSAAPSTNS